MGRFSIDINEGEILGILSYKANLAFFTKSKVGFAKVAERSIYPGFCEAGLADFTQVIMDTSNIGVVFGATNRNEIVVFETSVKGDNMMCKLKGRLTTPMQKDSGFKIKIGTS
mmetsp:Transcript_25594/g.19362  ORF Transcript_25594/g.19362 Transcript_25594/m.19362 type:complete len:113 (-) Transcript_25594:588-926(-)